MDAAILPNPPDMRARVPFAMGDSPLVPKERYFDGHFFELECERLWPHAWQMAARLEEIPYPGDFVEYAIVGASILIVRQQDGSVRALHNACRHRATELAQGCGRFSGGQIVCPFHGWRWNIDGSSSFVFLESAFERSCMRPEDLRLRECLVEVWAGMVWVNMDTSAPPLSDALAPVMPILDGLGVGNMRVQWWKQVVLEANWKLTMEAFLEAYHGMQTHPQLMSERGMDMDASVQLMEDMVYHALPGGHTRYYSRYHGSSDYGFDGDAFIETHRLLLEGQDAMVTDRDVHVFEGVRNKIGVDDPDFAKKAIAALYEHADGAGIPLAPMSESMEQWGGVVYMFPNYFILALYGNALVYRMRPHGRDTERCLLDVWSLTTYPSGREPERATLLGLFDKEDSENWGLIPRQDFLNIERQQRGLHSPSFSSMRLSPVQERAIINMHQELDRVLASGPE